MLEHAHQPIPFTQFKLFAAVDTCKGSLALARLSLSVTMLDMSVRRVGPEPFPITG